jgi:phosphoribosylaminoimidazolecarboxamide formyltransferase/IMP cyclohydrolase
VLFAPGYEDGALEALKPKEALRVLSSTERRRAPTGERDLRRVIGGLLAQDTDADVEDREGMIAVCGDPGESDWGDLLFGWRVCKHVTSNAIVIVKDLRTIGIGAGQMSRSTAVRIASRRRRSTATTSRAPPSPRRLLPVPGRPAPGARRGRPGDHPARRLEARLGRRRRRRSAPAARWSSPAAGTSATSDPPGANRLG